ncbi:MAG: aspartate aminotransferase family protein [Candidatus Saccharicenans sp.]|jgi:acetylornithine aminotransferase|nr:aspartate aminotransferase family protein [Candidatus Saccharicenans sp.]MDH7574757.1 aspartate aminotransferase family protein [Candidatus Saccharicenans sp.]
MHILRCHEIIKTDFTRAENCYLYDSQGNRYMDFESGIWCTVLGHNHPRINRVIESQLGKVAHLGTRYLSRITEEAAVEVLNISGLEGGKCVFLSSGSEAVEFGVQVARRLSGKPLWLTFARSYLGAYGSAGRKNTSEAWLLDWEKSREQNSEAYLDQIPFEQIGAFVFEPGGSGSGFVKFPPRQIVKAIYDRIKRAGGLVVVNEVTTGIGRTGKWFGFQHYDLEPDIVAMGKGLGNGYPVSAVAMKKELAEELEAGGFYYAQSHQNDPLGAAVAREVIVTLREENWIEKGREKGEYFLAGLKQLEGECELAKEARGRGMLLGLELRPDEQRSVQNIYRRLLDRGFLVGYYSAGNMLRFDPALTIDHEDIARLLEVLHEILS